MPHLELTDALVELIAERFRVLAEPARIRLLDALRSDPAQVGELAARVGLSQQNASKHLAVLHAAGLVARTRTGTTTRYAIVDPSVFALCELVCDALRDRYSGLQETLAAPDVPTADGPVTG